VTSAHFIFIPAVLAVGVVFGYVLGGRAAVDKVNMAVRKEKEREEAKQRRQERLAKK